MRRRRSVTSVLASVLLPLVMLAAAPVGVRADASPPLDPPAIPQRATGYWLAAGDGGLFTFGDAGFHGSLGGAPLAAPVVAIAPTPGGAGYWMAASDGGVFAFGDAPFLGSMGGRPLNRPIVGLAATPTGRGYWLVAADGGIFTFGDAGFHGSTGGISLNRPIVAMAASPSGRGYWLVAADGGIFAFGDAPFLGSTGGMRLNRPIVAMASTGLGGGYWLVASDGGIFSFGDAPFYGSTGNLQLVSPVLAIAARPGVRDTATATFYYPWYDAPGEGNAWRHWDDPNPEAADPAFEPPTSIASDFYPARGPYSTRSRTVVDAHMVDIARAGVDIAVISWWGRGSYEDRVLPLVVAAARAAGVVPAVHLEPYPGRTPESAAQDVEHLVGNFGVRDVWIYLSDGPPPTSWRTLTDSFPAVEFWGHSHRAANATSSLFPTYAAQAGFDGVYTYDPLPYSPDSFVRVCSQARARGLLCSPSVNPGYDDTRIRPGTGRQRSRRSGATYDEYWRGAFRSAPDVISVTSYNEWHEGTQIEGATAACMPGAGCYENYEGAYGRTGVAAAPAYLERTRAWTDALARASR